MLNNKNQIEREKNNENIQKLFPNKESSHH